MKLRKILNTDHHQSSVLIGENEDRWVVANTPNVDVDSVNPSDESNVIATIALNSSNDLNPIG